MSMGISLKLAKAGWWNGNPGTIMKSPADEVLAAAAFENFHADLERATFDLNKEKP